MKNLRNLGMYVKAVLVVIVLPFLFVQSALAAEPINVCYTTDFSSVDANLGIVAMKTVEMVVKDVNAAGGIKGRPIKLIVMDNKSDASMAMGNAKMFKDQYNCKIMYLEAQSSTAIALKPFGEKNKMLMISAYPQSDRLRVMNAKSWYFRTNSPSSLNVTAAMMRLKKLGFKKIAFEGNTLAWGTDALSTVKDLAPKYGLDLVNITQVEPKTKDLSIQVKKMKDSGAEAVLSVEYDAETAVLARAMAAIDWKPYYIHSTQATFASGLAMSDPKLFEGWNVISMCNPSKPEVQNVWKRVKAYAPDTRIDEDEKTIRAYESIAYLIAALKIAKNVDDGESIRDAMYNVDKNYKWTLGNIDSKGPFTTAQNHLLKAEDLVILTVRNGKMVAAD